MKHFFSHSKHRHFKILLLTLKILLWSVCGFAGSGIHGEDTTEFFPVIEGWGAPEKVEVYTPDILFDYINGAAELYLIYGFQELQVAEYVNGTGAYIVVEVYYHQTPELAFGIYSQERPEKEYYINMGTQGYMISPILNFLSGNAYVKINSSSLKENNREVLLAFAGKTAARLDANCSLPAILDFFPGPNKLEYSEKFIPGDFLGYEYLRNAYTAEYKDHEEDFTLFIIRGQHDSDCGEMLDRYMKFVKYTPEEPGQPLHRLQDPYHGEVVLMHQGAYIWGILGLEDKEKQKNYLMQMKAKITGVNGLDHL